jgi:tRNA-specific 2-thiouridylase
VARVAVLTSGGVDSSVALCRLVEEGGHSLTAFYIKIWLEDELAFLGSCPWQEDLDYLHQICDSCGVPLEVVSLQREYYRTVVGYALDELRAGRTPSPDVICNRAIKFGAFLSTIDGSFDLVASGHYARTVERDGTVHLLRSLDPVKDQTYFLCQLTQPQVARCRFPIGHLLKAEVRREAQRLNLPNRDRPDSQGICFLGRVPYDEFVAFHLGEQRGEILEHGSDRVLGTHRGHWFYTIGQRRGLGLAGGPWYVVGKDVRTNRVLVTHARDLTDHSRGALRIPTPNWIAAPPSSERLLLRIRHGERLIPCAARQRDDQSIDVTLGDPDPGVAPGQFAALYDGEECLGGGAIGF